jgi:beta-galactosidase
MSDTKFNLHPETPFPVGVEYYRGPIPKQEVWDEDFARIRAAGLQIVRSFSFWNWMEPAPGHYQLDDFDLMFDLAEKHGLYVWLDITLATHGACPEWLTREHPDIRAVDRHGQPLTPIATVATPQGAMIHCYDHPAWLEYGGNLLRHVVNRYKERPNLLVWGLWDGVSPISSGEGFPELVQ